MFVVDDVIYYTTFERLVADGSIANLYALDVKTCRNRQLLKDKKVGDIYAAGDGKLLLRLDPNTAPGFFLLSLEDESLECVTDNENEVEGFTRGESGLLFKKRDGTWALFDYETEAWCSIDEPIEGYRRIISPSCYIACNDPLNFGYTVFKNGYPIITIAPSEYCGVSQRGQYVIWSTAWSGLQRIRVLDVYASENTSQTHISEYKVDVCSNIFILDHYAFLMSNADACLLTVIDLVSGSINQISPYD